MSLWKSAKKLNFQLLKFYFCIFSGINNGTNIGDEISYSGTVAAAFEGALRGIPSIALSQARNNNNQKNFKVVEKFFPQVMSKINEIRFLDSSFFNVNFPNCDVTNCV